MPTELHVYSVDAPPPPANGRHRLRHRRGEYVVIVPLADDRRLVLHAGRDTWEMLGNFTADLDDAPRGETYEQLWVPRIPGLTA